MRTHRRLQPLSELRVGKRDTQRDTQRTRVQARGYRHAGTGTISIHRDTDATSHAALKQHCKDAQDFVRTQHQFWTLQGRKIAETLHSDTVASLLGFAQHQFWTLQGRKIAETLHSDTVASLLGFAQHQFWTLQGRAGSSE